MIKTEERVLYEGKVIGKEVFTHPLFIPTLGTSFPSNINSFPSNIYTIQTTSNNILEVDTDICYNIAEGAYVEVCLIRRRFWKLPLPEKRIIRYEKQEIPLRLVYCKN